MGLPVSLVVWFVFLAMAISAMVISPTEQQILGRLADTLVLGCGSIIVWKTDQKVIGWILITLGVMFTLLGGLMSEAGIESLERFVESVGMVVIVLVLYLMLIFPQGRLVTTLSRVVLWVGVIGGVGVSVYDWLTWDSQTDSYVGVLFFAALLPICVGIQIAYLKHRTPVERKQLKWFLYAVTLSGLMHLVAGLLGLPEEQFLIVDAIATSLWPIAILFAITKYHLYDIDRIVSRSVAYAILVGILAAVFLSLVAGITALLPTQNSLAVAGATLAVAALFNPLRVKVQGAIDRRFNRDRYDSRLVVDRFTGELGAEADMEQLTSELTGVVEETLQPAALGVWIREE